MAAITLVIAAINGVVIYVYLDNIIHIVVFHIYSTKQFIIYKFLREAMLNVRNNITIYYICFNRIYCNRIV